MEPREKGEKKKKRKEPFFLVAAMSGQGGKLKSNAKAKDGGGGLYWAVYEGGVEGIVQNRIFARNGNLLLSHPLPFEKPVRKESQLYPLIAGVAEEEQANPTGGIGRHTRVHLQKCSFAGIIEVALTFEEEDSLAHLVEYASDSENGLELGAKMVSLVDAVGGRLVGNTAALKDGRLLERTIVRLGMRGIDCALLTSVEHSTFLCEKMSRVAKNKTCDAATCAPVREAKDWCPLALDGREFYTLEGLGRHLSKTVDEEAAELLPDLLRDSVEAQRDMAAWEEGRVMGPVSKPAPIKTLVKSIGAEANILLLTAYLYKKHADPVRDAAFVEMARVNAVLLYFGLQGWMPRKIGRYERTGMYRMLFAKHRVFSDETKDALKLTEESLARCEIVDGVFVPKKRRTSSSETAASSDSSASLGAAGPSGTSSSDTPASSSA